MRSVKRAGRYLVRCSLIGYLLMASSVLLIPFAMNADGSLNVYGIVAGALFWLGLIVGLLFFFFGWKTVHRESLYRKIRSWQRPGFLGVLQTPAAKLIDFLLLISLMATVIGNTLVHFPEHVMFPVLFLLILTFFWHFVLNGRVYIYTIHKGRKKRSVTISEFSERKEVQDEDLSVS